jgi:hypothetical protein
MMWSWIKASKKRLNGPELKKIKRSRNNTTPEFQIQRSNPVAIFLCFSSTLQYFCLLESFYRNVKGVATPGWFVSGSLIFNLLFLFYLKKPKNIVIVKHLTKKRKLISLQHVRNAAKRQI